MGIFSGLFKSRDKPQNRTAGSNYAFFLGGTTSGKAVTERSAMQMAAVYSCVRILSEAVAGLPLHLYKYTDSGGKAMALDHPLYHLFSAPSYDAEFISIPGRNGDLINPNRRFSNIKVTYTVFLARKNTAALASVLRDIKGWLYCEPDRYHELTDSYDVEYFRYAVISGSLDIEEQLNKIGCFTVTFNCKPFKNSYEGQQTIADGNPRLTVTNPTAFDSKPYIKIYGSGTVRLMLTPGGQGTTTWVLSDVDEYIEIDSELMNCYKDTVLKNDTVTGESFPMLKPGENSITCAGNVRRVEVIPRWRCL